MEKIGLLVLAGGASRRMGRPKPELKLNGVPLLQVSAGSCPDAQQVVVVGPDTFSGLLDPDLPAIFVREEPPGGGPVAGLVAGLRALSEDVEVVQILTCDLPHAPDIVSALAAHSRPCDADALVPVDDEGWPQFLAGRYRVSALRDALAVVGDGRGRSVRRALGGLQLCRLPLPSDVLADVDDPAAARAAGLS